MPTISKYTARTAAAALIAVAVPVAGTAQGNPAACSAAQDSLNAGVFLWSGTLELRQCGSTGASVLATLIAQSATSPLDSSFRFVRLRGLARFIVSPVVTSAAIVVPRHRTIVLRNNAHSDESKRGNWMPLVLSPRLMKALATQGLLFSVTGRSYATSRSSSA
jgi:hypothetical protein